ncbi:TonB-dependent receptor [Sphingomonas histidinilytica]|uniref:Outer membrane receptor proteins, mostly Fe transport n=1 Tax=Rhizorhabdus histidinilytica TaxID=439228 RepID=A0A1T5FM29_9SPHN|nr:TonB-dependent receptor [Rhizorhabdus histidinilytica]MBO9380095.1 TonB-dependent receptor [Rhizorhabdus histidinilytica]SKB97156.1 Outer membrane receptor proteins, mostly Fe transport [Rhizorhabdus histidinilytica]
MLKEVRNHHLFVTASAAAILIACFQSGAAQATATPPPADEQTADRIEEIVVTAQKRSENLQRVPISAQVMTGASLNRSNIASLTDIAEIAPSVHVATGGRSNNIYVRGTGSAESQSLDQSVAIFIDDVYHGRSRGSSATFLDLERVEVLKGPQSTYFGNNAIAGAFNIVTHRPDQSFNGWIRGLISPRGGTNGGQYALEGAVNVPLTDALALRVAGTFNGQRGWLKNVNTGKRAPDEENTAFRATLRYQPSDDLDIALKGEIGRNLNKSGLLTQNASCPPPAPFVAAGFCALNLSLGLPIGLKRNTLVLSDGQQIRLNTKETVLSIRKDLGASTLSSVTAYNQYRYRYNLDADGTPLTLLNVQAPEKYRQFSQELRLASPTGQPIEWLAGLYFQYDKLDIEQSTSFNFLSPVIAATPPFAPLVARLPLGQFVAATQKERVYSAFGAITWNASDRLKLTAGLRGSITTKDFDWSLLFGTATRDYGGIVALPSALQPLPGLLGLGTSGQVALSRNDKALMPSARAQYQITPEAMVYASYSRGFKAGGFSVADTTALPANFPFAPERVDAYEIGLKSELFDRHVLLNVALFRNDFNKLQVSITTAAASGAFLNFIRNAGSARSQGVEVETQWLVSRAFRIAASGSYLDSKYLRYRNAGPTSAQQLAGIASQDLSGRRTPFAPRWSGTTSATLTLPLGSQWRFVAEATGIFSSSYQTYSTLDPLTLQPSYARLDGRLSLESDDGRWAVDLIGKNLGNATVRAFSVAQPLSLGSLAQTKEQLRNLALQLRYKF